MNRLRRLALSLVVGFSSLGPVAIAAGPACADSSDHAALVIDTGSQVLEYCVSIGGTVSGIDLIKAASKQYGLNYALGYGGKGVCRLAGIGSASNDCLADDKPNFWGYWRGTGSGGWSWSSLGAASTQVSPGSVEGWAWGSGTSGGAHPQPPNTDFEDVCKTDKPDSGGGSGGGGGGGGNDEKDRTGSTSDDDSSKQQAGDQRTDGDSKDKNTDGSGGDASQDKPSGTTDEARERTTAGDTTGDTEGVPPPEGDPQAIALASGAEEQAGGSSAAGWIGALLIIAGLTAGGVVAMKRRDGPKHARKR